MERWRRRPGAGEQAAAPETLGNMVRRALLERALSTICVCLDAWSFVVAPHGWEILKHRVQGEGGSKMAPQKPDEQQESAAAATSSDVPYTTYSVNKEGVVRVHKVARSVNNFRCPAFLVRLFLCGCIRKYAAARVNAHLITARNCHHPSSEQRAGQYRRTVDGTAEHSAGML